jgi:hypothetical protein
MEKNLILLTIYILAGIVIYLGGSFYFATFDIAKWTESGRECSLVFWIFIIYCNWWQEF